MRFCATELRADGEYGVEFDAPSWEAAIALCEQNDWLLGGELKATIAASEIFGEKEANELIDAANEAQEAVRH